MEIPPIWKIYPIILIMHLKPASNPANNSYQRLRLDYLGPVEPKDNAEPTRDYYVIEKLLGKRLAEAGLST